MLCPNLALQLSLKKKTIHTKLIHIISTNVVMHSSDVSYWQDPWQVSFLFFKVYIFLPDLF